MKWIRIANLLAIALCLTLVQIHANSSIIYKLKNFLLFDFVRLALSLIRLGFEYLKNEFLPFSKRERPFRNNNYRSLNTALKPV
jgi:hypothetical protein